MSQSSGNLSDNLSAASNASDNSAIYNTGVFDGVDEEDDTIDVAPGDGTLLNKRMELLIVNRAHTIVEENAYHDVSKLNRFANNYPSDGQWDKVQGERGFNTYFAHKMHAAMQQMEDNNDIKAGRVPSNCDDPDRARKCTVNTLTCERPDRDLKRPSDVPISLKPYQMTVKYMFSPSTENAIQRMLFGHGLGTGKTISMIQILDNFASSTRPKVFLFYSVQHINGFFRELCKFQSYTREWLVCRTENWFTQEQEQLYQDAQEAVTLQKLKLMQTHRAMLWRGPISQTELYNDCNLSADFWGPWEDEIDPEIESWFPKQMNLKLEQYDKSLLPYYVIVEGESAINAEVPSSTYNNVFERCAAIVMGMRIHDWLKFFVSIPRFSSLHAQNTHDKVSIAIVMLTYLDGMLKQCTKPSSTPSRDLITLAANVGEVLKSIQEIAEVVVTFKSLSVFATAVKRQMDVIRALGTTISIDPVRRMYPDQSVKETFSELHEDAMQDMFGDNSGETTWDLCTVDMNDVIETMFPDDNENSEQKKEKYMLQLQKMNDIEDREHRQLLIDEIVCNQYIIGYRGDPPAPEKNSYIQLRRAIRRAAQLRQLYNIFHTSPDGSVDSRNAYEKADDMIQGASQTTDEGATILSFVQSLLRFTNHTSSQAMRQDSGERYVLGSPVIAVNYVDFCAKAKKRAQSTWSNLLRYGKDWANKVEVGYTTKEKIIVMDEAHNLLRAGTLQLEMELEQKRKKQAEGNVTQKLLDDINRLERSIERESLSRDEIRAKLLNPAAYADSRLALFTATPIISSVNDLSEMMDVVCGKSHDSVESMDGFVSFFRGRPKGVFPQHRPPGDAPEIRVVVPTYGGSSDPLRPIVRDCCKFKNYKSKIKKPRKRKKKKKDSRTPETPEPFEVGEFSLSVDPTLGDNLTKNRVKLMRRNLQDYAVDNTMAGPNLVLQMEMFLGKYENKILDGATRDAMNREYRGELLPLAIIKCPKLLEIAKDVADEEENHLRDGLPDDGQKTIVMVAEGQLASEGEGIVTMTLLLRVEATRRNLIREKWAQEAAYEDPPNNPAIEIKRKFAHLGTGENMPLARQCDRGKLVNQLKRVNGSGQGVPEKCQDVGGDLTMRSVFAAKDNARGWGTKVFVANASAYTESVSFENVRRIILASVPATAHSMLQQIGRASRLCKHGAFMNDSNKSYLDVQIYLTAIPIYNLVGIFQEKKCTRFEGYSMGKLFPASVTDVNSFEQDNVCGNAGKNTPQAPPVFTRENVVEFIQKASMPDGEAFADSQWVQGLRDYQDTPVRLRRPVPGTRERALRDVTNPLHLKQAVCLKDNILRGLENDAPISEHGLRFTQSQWVDLEHQLLQTQIGNMSHAKLVVGIILLQHFLKTLPIDDNNPRALDALAQLIQYNKNNASGHILFQIDTNFGTTLQHSREDFRRFLKELGSAPIMSVKDIGSILHTADTYTYQNIEKSLYEFQASYRVLRDISVDHRILDTILGPPEPMSSEADEIYNNLRRIYVDA